MALRQLLHNDEEIICLLRRPSNLHCAPVCSYEKTVWAIVFIFACATRGGPEVSLSSSAEIRAYDVSATRYSNTYHPRIYRGLLATDGKRHRIAFYWFDPVAECEQMDSMAFSDFLFSHDEVLYWHHKDAKQQHTLPFGLPHASEGGQLPKENTFDSIIQSILNLVMYNITDPAGNNGTMETARFFQKARTHNSFDCTVEPPASESDDGASISRPSTDNFRNPNQLPFGRKYCKQIDQKGNVIWLLSKTTISRDLVRVTIKPKSLSEMSGLTDIFDVNSLGLWSAIPGPYRQFWSLWHRSRKLRHEPNVWEAKRLYTDIDSCLQGSLPDEVNLALNKLLFKASLETGSSEAMSLSARQYFQAYKRLAQQPVDLILVELGHITKELRNRWLDEQTRDFILPMLRSLVDPKVFNYGFVNNFFFDQIQVRGSTWSLYGQIVLESIQGATSLDSQFLAHLASKVDNSKDGMDITDSEENQDNSVQVRREIENNQKKN